MGLAESVWAFTSPALCRRTRSQAPICRAWHRLCQPQGREQLGPRCPAAMYGVEGRSITRWVGWEQSLQGSIITGHWAQRKWWWWIYHDLAHFDNPFPMKTCLFWMGNKKSKHRQTVVHCGYCTWLLLFRPAPRELWIQILKHVTT